MYIVQVHNIILELFIANKSLQQLLFNWVVWVIVTFIIYLVILGARLLPIFLDANL